MKLLAQLSEQVNILESQVRELELSGEELLLVNEELTATNTKQAELITECRDMLNNKNEQISSLQTTLSQKPPIMTQSEHGIFQTNRDIEKFTARRDRIAKQRAYEIAQRFLVTYYQLYYPGILKPTEDNISKRLDDRQNQDLGHFSNLYNLRNDGCSSEFLHSS